MLYWYGFKLGIHSLIRGNTSREVIKNIIVPVNYWRMLEFRLTFAELCPQPTDRILDLGSPKLLSLFLAEVVGAEVYSTDIDDYFIKDYLTFCDVRGVPRQRFHAATADGRSLPFADNYFPKIFSISVLEHIPNDGDSACVREIARTLAPQGTCVITVPFSPIGRDEYKSPKDFYWAKHVPKGERTTRVFFQRRYSETTLYERLIRPSGLQLHKLHFVGERFPLPDGTEVSKFLPRMAGPIHPLLSLLFQTQPESDWKRLRKPLCAIIIMKKD